MPPALPLSDVTTSQSTGVSRTAAILASPLSSIATSRGTLPLPRPIISADPLLHDAYDSLQLNNDFARELMCGAGDDLSWDGILETDQMSLVLYFFCKFLHKTIHCITPLLMLNINLHLHIHNFLVANRTPDMRQRLEDIVKKDVHRYDTPGRGKLRTVTASDYNGQSRKQPLYDKAEAGRMTENLLFGGEVHGIP